MGWGDGARTGAWSLGSRTAHRPPPPRFLTPHPAPQPQPSSCSCLLPPRGQGEAESPGGVLGACEGEHSSPKYPRAQRNTTLNIK